jgi:hypothetical protein
MTSEDENLLWLRVAALRGIEVPKREGTRAVSTVQTAPTAPILGERFAVRISRARLDTGEIERASRLVSAPSCQGVIGEIIAPAAEAANDAPRRSRIPTTRGYTLEPLGWHRGLIEQEGERLRRAQAERRST